MEPLIRLGTDDYGPTMVRKRKFRNDVLKLLPYVVLCVDCQRKMERVGQPSIGGESPWSAGKADRTPAPPKTSRVSPTSTRTTRRLYQRLRVRRRSRSEPPHKHIVRAAREKCTAWESRRTRLEPKFTPEFDFTWWARALMLAPTCNLPVFTRLDLPESGGSYFLLLAALEHQDLVNRHELAHHVRAFARGV